MRRVAFILTRAAIVASPSNGTQIHAAFAGRAMPSDAAENKCRPKMTNGGQLHHAPKFPVVIMTAFGKKKLILQYSKQSSHLQNPHVSDNDK